jgi:hypothetical protein
LPVQVSVHACAAAAVKASVASVSRHVMSGRKRIGATYVAGVR